MTLQLKDPISPVSEVEEKKFLLKDGRQIPFGLLIWSTGIDQTNLVKSLSLDKDTSTPVGPAPTFISNWQE